MPVICVERPSAVGKSSIARWLVEHVERMWNYERQIERVQIGRAQNPDWLVILDGDPFQPVWYNRLYPAVNDLS